MSKVLILTGGSKGLGFGISTVFLKNGFKVISIARTKNVSIQNDRFIQLTYDLLAVDFMDQFTSILLEELKQPISELILINNAGTLGIVNRIESIPINDIVTSYQLNTILPIQMSSVFIELTKQYHFQKTILCISSGAAQNAKYGWSIYCSTKAAIDHFTRVVGLEQAEKQKPVKILSIYPGIVDTEMQEIIRNSSKDAFQDVDQFIEFKETNKLIQPEIVAKEIEQIYYDTSIKNGSIVKVVDYRN